MAGNQVTLTLAGDSTKLEAAFDRVGASAKTMSTEVGEAGKGFDRAGEAADALDTRAMGFRDTMTGVQDTMKGTAEIAKGNLFEGFLTLGMGIGDLGSGFYNFLIPSMKSAVSWMGKTKVGMLAQAAASGIVKAATVTWTAVQWLLNAALTANPIGLIIVGIGLLVAAIVWIALKTTWFQTAWKFAWRGIKAAAVAVWNWLKGVPSAIGNVFSKVARFISAPFRAAFNFIADAWNNTVGRLSWSVPGWVPFIGGNTISVPHLPRFHTGGVVPGAPGTEVVARLQAGERVVQNGAGARGSIGPDDLRMGSSTGFDRVMLTYLEGLLRRNNLRLVRA